MNTNAPVRLSYTIEEAVSATGFSRSRLYEAIADGTLETFKSGRRRMITASALDSYIAKLVAACQGRAGE